MRYLPAFRKGALLRLCDGTAENEQILAASKPAFLSLTCTSREIWNLPEPLLSCRYLRIALMPRWPLLLFRDVSTTHPIPSLVSGFHSPASKTISRMALRKTRDKYLHIDVAARTVRGRGEKPLPVKTQLADPPSLPGRLGTHGMFQFK